MQIVILAAGRGMRMKDLTDSVPKPMLEIKGKPILAYKIEALPEEIDEVIFVVGYLGNKIQDYFGNSYAGKKISYVVQEKLDGTGGAMSLVKDLIVGDFLVMNGDDLYMHDDIKRIMEHDVALLGFEVANPRQFGIISLDEKGLANEIVEKPDIEGPAFANAGLYKLRRNFFEYPLVKISETEYGLPQTLMQTKDIQSITVEKATGWFPIGNPEDLKKAEEIIDKFI
jgi:bifunctional UDP-N-acetylglucosamine pyrophosphorylase/glucosamine-1-phosphate N-acetyltransferase